MEHDNVRDSLRNAIEISEATEIKTRVGINNYRLATVEDVQEMIREHLYNIAELLGMEEFQKK